MVVVTDYDFDADLCEAELSEKIAKIIAMQTPFGEEREPARFDYEFPFDPDYPKGFLNLE